jgi:hypothetical protein
MGRLGQSEGPLDPHWYPLLPEQQCLEPSYDQGAADLERRIAISVHYSQRSDQHPNWTFGHGSAPGWYGVTLNYQQDDNNKKQSYNIYLDNLTLVISEGRDEDVASGMPFHC